MTLGKPLWILSLKGYKYFVDNISKKYRVLSCPVVPPPNCLLWGKTLVTLDGSNFNHSVMITLSGSFVPFSLTLYNSWIFQTLHLSKPLNPLKYVVVFFNCIAVGWSFRVKQLLQSLNWSILLETDHCDWCIFTCINTSW